MSKATEDTITSILRDELARARLGYEGNVNELLDGLYESLADEIELLKRLMGARLTNG